MESKIEELTNIIDSQQDVINNQKKKLSNMDILIEKYTQLQNKHDKLMEESITMSRALAEKNNTIYRLEQY